MKRMASCWFVAILALAFVRGASGQGTDPDVRLPVPRFEQDSTSFPVAVPSDYRALTGYLVVYENRKRPDGPTIRLPVAVLRARSAQAEPSPVLYLAGGPGSSALNAAAYPGAYPWTTDRDFIVLGQRGTGFADPALTCPEFGNARTGSGLSSLAAASLDAQLFAASRCRAELLAAGIDPAAYSTAASAADVEDLRRVLGVREWTLYGVSYGTRLALAVLRDFPGTVRAAVLDSALPPQARYDDESASNLEAAFELALRDCTASSDCRSAYPNLRVRFFDALQAADASPVVVSIPGADGPRPLGLVGADLASLISTASTSGIANAPRLLDAVARRDTSVLGPLVRGSFGPSDFAWGMRLSVWCGESLPYTARATAEGPGSALAGLELAVVPPAVCQEWSVPVRPEREVSPVDSDVPVLLIAGEYDPATPPKWAYEAVQTLSNGRVVVLRAAGHVPTQDWEGDGCAMRLASAFVSSPADFDPAKEGEGCLAARSAPEFVIEDP